MAVTWRDMSIPYTKGELDELSKGIQSLSSYDPKDGGTISPEQVPEVLKLMGMERTAEQIEVCKNYWNNHFGGRLYLDLVLNVCKNIHKDESFFRSTIENLDKDKDGYISEEEFDDVLKILLIQTPALKDSKITFENFAKEADTSQDGRVSLDECCRWLKNKINPEF